MVLTGEGGDELFAGYARYAGERLAPDRSARCRRRCAGSARAWPAGRSRPRRARASPCYALCQPRRAAAVRDVVPAHVARTRASRARRRRARRGRRPRRARDALRGARWRGATAPDPISRMLYVDTKLWLPDDLLARGDKMSMAASLEARVPLLDHRLVEFAASLPPDLKVHGLTRKYLLRKVAADLLPEPILRRTKKGFPMPMAAWLRGEARELCHDLALAGRGPSPGPARARARGRAPGGARQRHGRQRTRPLGAAQPRALAPGLRRRRAARDRGSRGDRPCVARGSCRRSRTGCVPTSRARRPSSRTR